MRAFWRSLRPESAEKPLALSQPVDVGQAAGQRVHVEERHSLVSERCHPKASRRVRKSVGTGEAVNRHVADLVHFTVANLRNDCQRPVRWRDLNDIDSIFGRGRGNYEISIWRHDNVRESLQRPLVGSIGWRSSCCIRIDTVGDIRCVSFEGQRCIWHKLPRHCVSEKD
jgi:hypothetical protein